MSTHEFLLCFFAMYLDFGVRLHNLLYPRQGQWVVLKVWLGLFDSYQLLLPELFGELLVLQQLLLLLQGQ